DVRAAGAPAWPAAQRAAAAPGLWDRHPRQPGRNRGFLCDVVPLAATRDLVRAAGAGAAAAAAAARYVAGAALPSRGAVRRLPAWGGQHLVALLSYPDLPERARRLCRQRK